MSATEDNPSTQHFPVLLGSTLEYLNPQGGDRYLDLTAGYAGHADAVLERTLGYQSATLVDRDQNAIDYLRQHFKGHPVEILHDDFYTAAVQLRAKGRQFDVILADLGVSSPHLDNPERGFSIQNNGPLDMRMDPRQEFTAAQIVNGWSQKEIVSILREYGEEPYATRVAKSIMSSRPIKTTEELAAAVKRAYGPRAAKSRVHPATRTFQALRMEVNSEVELLSKALPVWIDLLAPGGRIVVISFHSLEDRLVKKAFGELSGNRYDAVLQELTKRPVTADDTELVQNPRARSAKLRAAAKIKTERGSPYANPGKEPLPGI